LGGCGKKKKKEERKERKKKEKRRFPHYRLGFKTIPFLDEFWGLLYPFPRALTIKHLVRIST
jgi:hypothetical protein